MKLSRILKIFIANIVYGRTKLKYIRQPIICFKWVFPLEKRGENDGLITYNDSDYTCGLVDRKSTLGFLFV